MIRIVIGAALKTELKYLRPQFEGVSDVDLLLTGVGRNRCVKALEECLRQRLFDRLLLVGSCGSLLRIAGPGTLLVPHTTIDYTTGESVPVDGPFRQRLAERLTASGIDFATGIMVTVKRGIKSDGDRETVCGRTGGSAVDMESHFVNRWARVHGVPLAILRVVTDIADDSAMSDFRKNLHGASGRLAAIVEKLDLPGLLQSPSNM